ncbi:MAG: hypothetical protein ABJ308_15740 [Halieaceae bacterium]
MEKALAGSIKSEDLYMLAPLLYSQKHHMNDEAILQIMIDENEAQVAEDASHDPHSRERFKFHYVSSYLFCSVVAGKIDEFEYDRIMEYVNDEMDLFS